jgi:hypothetical protein
MKKKVDTSQGLNTSSESQTTTPQNQKTKAGQAISSIWTGIKNIFTGKTASPVTATGTTLEVKDNQGNVVASKNTNTNWGVFWQVWDFCLPPCFQMPSTLALLTLNQTQVFNRSN